MAVHYGKNDDGSRGKIGNLVKYELNGKIISRSIGKSKKPPTIPMLHTRQGLSLSMKVVQVMLPLIRLGYSQEAKANHNAPYNSAMRHLLKDCIMGEYPDRKVNYAEVMTSKGMMPLPENIAVTPVVDGLNFSWDASVFTKGIKDTDQVMLMAYIPERDNAIYNINAGPRAKGNDVLLLNKFKNPVTIETYISFISADHKNISNSFYTGQIIWPGTHQALIQ